MISVDPATREPLLTAPPNLSVTNPDYASLLGSHLGTVDCIDQVYCDKTVSLQTMGDRLSYIHAQDALLLLHHSFSIPKPFYTLCTSPCFLSHKLSIYDNILKSITSKITNVPLGDLDTARTQGGLGIQGVVQLSPSAFSASAAGSSGLVSHILSKHLQIVPYAARAEALSSRMQRHDSPPPPDPVAHRQRMWDLPRVCATSQALIDNASDARSHARLLAVCRSESGAWLQALPVPSLGLRLVDETTRVAVGL